MRANSSESSAYCSLPHKLKCLKYADVNDYIKSDQAPIRSLTRKFTEKRNAVGNLRFKLGSRLKVRKVPPKGT